MTMTIGMTECGNREWSRETGCPRVARSSGWLLLLLIASSSAFDNATDPFVQKCQTQCSTRGDFASCGKYKAARWLHTFVREKEFSYGPFRVIRIPSMHKQSFLPNLPRSRAFKSSITEVLNFIRDNIEDFVTKRAIVYTVDNSAIGRSFSTSLMVLDDDEIKQLKDKNGEGDWRIFKKKKSIILPVLILLNLLKLKLLLLPIFLGVHFIKKLLVLGSLVLPSVLAHLKVCKVPTHHAHPYHIWSSSAEAAPVDYPSGYAQDDWHRNDYSLGYPSFQIFRNPYG